MLFGRGSAASRLRNSEDRGCEALEVVARLRAFDVGAGFHLRLEGPTWNRAFLLELGGPSATLHRECSAGVSQRKALMKEIIGGLAANFIVAGIVASLEGKQAGAISFGIGLVLLALWLLLFRKKTDAASAPSIHQEAKIIQSPVVEFHVGDSGVTDRERGERVDDLVLEFIRRTHPGSAYTLTEILDRTGLKELQVRAALRRLVDMKVLCTYKTYVSAGDNEFWLLVSR